MLWTPRYFYDKEVTKYQTTSLKTAASILLITEGTYPYHNGGVSTWAHQLCEKIEQARFHVYSINAGDQHESIYVTAKNLAGITPLPIWSPDEPRDITEYELSYPEFIARRERTTSTDIISKFVPYFQEFLYSFLTSEKNMVNLDLSVYGMWKFFNEFDYKLTMTSRPVWDCYKKTLAEALPLGEYRKINLKDLTTGLRWLYRFMMPISVAPPKADIAHMTISGVAVFPALSLKYRFNSPLILTEHGVYIRERLIAIGSSDFSPFLKRLLISFSEALTRLVYYHADVITTVSAYNIRWEKYYGADASKIKVIYNGVDTQLFVPGPKPEALSKTPTVVAAARIFALKDIETMIRVCAEVVRKIPNVLFLVYGNKDAVPDYTRQCELLIEELGLAQNFLLKGFHNAPEAIYREGDISILTSVSEGFPYTVLESMSCGIPVVATNVGGVSEALTEDCGFLCKPRAYEELASKVIWLLENENHRLRMGANCRDRVLNNFTLEHFTSAFDQTYQSLTGDREVEQPEKVKIASATHGKHGIKFS